MHKSSLLLLSLLWSNPVSALTVAPPQETKECQISSGEWAQCLKLEVPENRSKPSGRNLTLNVVVYKAGSSAKPGAPLFLLAGGPGQSAVESFAVLPESFRRLNRNHDIVLIDQRGTGESHPLRCVEEKDSLWDLAWDENLSKTMMKNCVDRLSKNADLTAYTTDASVEDMDAVRQALGYQKIIVFGVSYGTRLALRYLALHPESVEKQILEGVLSPDVNIIKKKSMPASLQSLSAFCKQDSFCQKYGDPWDTYQKLMEKWSAHPKVRIMDPTTGVLKEVILRPELLESFVTYFLYSPIDMSIVPPILYAASQGDYGPLIAKSFSNDYGVYDGLHFVLTCAEDFRDMGVAQTLAERLLTENCRLLPASQLPRDFRVQPPSDVLTLMLSGGLDPVTPPSYGQSLRNSLSRATHLILPDYGHNISQVSCVQDAMIHFVESDKPSIELPDCMKKLKGLHFFKGGLSR